MTAPLTADRSTSPLDLSAPTSGPTVTGSVAQTSLSVRVLGTPAPQGSKRAFRNKYTGRIQQVESSEKVKPWREAVKHAAIDAIEAAAWVRLEGAVEVDVTFVLPRNKGHFGSGRNAHLLKPSAPLFPVTGPDLDKLIRSTMDALGDAGVWRDDKQIVHVDPWKVYESDHDGLPGAHILVRELTS